MRKIISIVTVLCFLLSNFSFALSPPLLFDDIGDNTDKHKLLVLAEIGLQRDLQLLDNIRDIDDPTDVYNIREAFEKSGKFGRPHADIAQTYPNAPQVMITSYFNEFSEKNQIAPHIFWVSVSVEKAGHREDYILLFSTKRDDNGGFPIALCTKEELDRYNKKLRKAIKSRDELPERQPSDKLAMEGYRKNEKYDEIIKLAHDNGLAIPSGEIGIPLVIRVEDIREIALIGFSRFNKDGADTLLHPKKRECYIIPLDAKIGKTTVRNMLKKAKVTVVAEDGTTKEIVAYCHSSNNAIHLFLEDNEIYHIRNNYPSYQRVREQIGAKFAHEFGVMCGRPVLRFRGDRPINEFDERYREGLTRLNQEGVGYQRGKGYYPGKDIRQMPGYKAYELQDLDTNLKTRDYAGGEARRGVKVNILNSWEFVINFPDGNQINCYTDFSRLDIEEPLNDILAQYDIDVFEKDEVIVFEKDREEIASCWIERKDGIISEADIERLEDALGEVWPICIGGKVEAEAEQVALVQDHVKVKSETKTLTLTEEAVESLIRNLGNKDENVADKARELLSLALLHNKNNVVSDGILRSILDRLEVLGKKSIKTPAKAFNSFTARDYRLFLLGIDNLPLLNTLRSLISKETLLFAAIPQAKEILIKHSPRPRDYEKACLLFAFVLKCKMQPEQIDMPKIVSEAVNQLLNANNDSAYLLLSSLLDFEDTKDVCREKIENVIPRTIGNLKSPTSQKLGSYRLLLLACEHKIGIEEIKNKMAALLHGPVSSHLIHKNPAIIDMAQKFLLSYYDTVKEAKPDKDLILDSIAESSSALMNNLSNKNDNIADRAKTLLSLALREKRSKAESIIGKKINTILSRRAYIERDKYTFRLLSLGLEFNIETENIKEAIANTFKHLKASGKTPILGALFVAPYMFKEQSIPKSGDEAQKIDEAVAYLYGGIEEAYTVEKISDAYWALLFLLSHATSNASVEMLKDRMNLESIMPNVISHLSDKNPFLKNAAQKLLLQWYGAPKEVVTDVKSTVSQPQKRPGRPTEPGRSPEDARKVIINSPTILDALEKGEYFTITNYLERYDEVASELGFRKKRPARSTVSKDLDGLIKEGFLLKQKVKGKNRYFLTTKGKEQIGIISKIIEKIEIIEKIQPNNVELQHGYYLMLLTLEYRPNEQIKKLEVLLPQISSISGRICVRGAFLSQGIRPDEQIKELKFLLGQAILASDLDAEILIYQALCVHGHNQVEQIKGLESVAERVQKAGNYATEARARDALLYIEHNRDEQIERLKAILKIASEDAVGASTVFCITKILERHETLKNNQRPKTLKGRSPEDATRIIAIAPAIRIALEEEACFTIKIYREGYLQAAPLLGLPSRAPSDSTILRDLKGVIGMGYLVKKKENGENHYYLTDLGKSVFKRILTDKQAAPLEELLSHITVSKNEDLMGKAAAEAILHDIEKAVDEKGRAIMLFASAPSQHSTWKWLIKLWNELESARQKYLRNRIIAFHMDEYLGLPENAKQLFGKVLREMLYTKLQLNPDNVFYLNDRIAYEESLELRKAIEDKDQAEIDRLTQLVEEKVQPHIDKMVKKFMSYGGKFDIVVGGIGKIPHVAFNDPSVADFNDPLTIKVVRMDEESRKQQVIDEEFEKLSDVPTHALTFTLPPIFSAGSIYIIVPRGFKAESVRRTLENEISTKDPASGLRMKQVLPHVKFFFDMNSIKKSRIAQLALARQKAEEMAKNIWNVKTVEKLHPLYGAQLKQRGIYKDSVVLLDEKTGAFSFIANDGKEDIVIFVYKDRSKIENKIAIFEEKEAFDDGKILATICKFNPTKYRNIILENPEANIGDIGRRMAALRYKIGRPASGLAPTPATDDSVYVFLKKAQERGAPLSLIFSEPQIGAGDKPGYFAWNKQDVINVVDTLVAKMGITIPLTIERDHGKIPEDLEDVLKHWNSALMDYSNRNADKDKAGKEKDVDAIRYPQDIYEFYKENILLLADKIGEAEKIQKQTGLQKGLEIAITEVGKKPTPASHTFYFLYYLYKELERRGISLRPTLSEAQIGTIHGYGAENKARRDLLRDSSAIMGIFHLGQAAHGTSGTTKETLALYPELGVAHAHIFTDFIVAEFRAILEHDPELFLKYTWEALEYPKTKKAFNDKKKGVRTKYFEYNKKRLVVNKTSYEEFIKSGKAAESVSLLMQELDKLTPKQADKRRFADSNTAILWFILQRGRYLLDKPWSLKARNKFRKNPKFIKSMETYVGAQVDKFITLFNNVDIVNEMASLTPEDLRRVEPITVGKDMPKQLISRRIKELIWIIYTTPNKEISELAKKDLIALINIPFIRDNAYIFTKTEVVMAACEATRNIDDFSMIDFLFSLARNGPLAVNAWTSEGSDYVNFGLAKKILGFEGTINGFSRFVKQAPIENAILKRLVELRPATMIESEDLATDAGLPTKALKLIPQKKGRPKQPGRSPEDAWRIIMNAPAIEKALTEDGYFTTVDYRRAYAQVAHSLGFPENLPGDAMILQNLKDLVSKGYLIREKKGPAYQYSLAPKGKQEFECRRLIDEAMATLPEEYKQNGMNREGLLEGFQAVNIVLERGLTEKHALIFSKKLAFDFGLGILLAKVAGAGINVAVIAPRDKQKERIRQLNDEAGLVTEDKEIIFIDRIQDIQSAMAAKGRTVTHSYHFRDRSEKHPDLGESNSVTYIALAAEKIIQALREATDTAIQSLQENFDRAIKLFKQAA